MVLEYLSSTHSGVPAVATDFFNNAPANCTNVAFKMIPVGTGACAPSRSHGYLASVWDFVEVSPLLLARVGELSALRHCDVPYAPWCLTAGRAKTCTSFQTDKSKRGAHRRTALSACSVWARASFFDLALVQQTRPASPSGVMAAGWSCDLRNPLRRFPHCLAAAQGTAACDTACAS